MCAVDEAMLVISYSTAVSVEYTDTHRAGTSYATLVRVPVFIDTRYLVVAEGKATLGVPLIATPLCNQTRATPSGQFLSCT